MKEFNKLLQTQFNKMSETGKLFRSTLSGATIFNLYLESFESDPIFRDPCSSEHNCNTCSNFIRRYGNIISIDENFNIQTIFDVETVGEYENTAKTLSAKIKEHIVSDVFVETFDNLSKIRYEEKLNKNQEIFQLGIPKNIKRYTKEEAEKFGVVKPNETIEFNHIHLFIKKEFISFTKDSVESIVGSFRDAKNVFQRAMETIPLDVLELVRDLINQDSILDGKTHLFKVEKMIELKKVYDSIDENLRDNWCWASSYKLQFAKFRNELIGTLCSDIAGGEDLNTACKTWNKRVDPINYMKTSAPITKKQIEDAKNFVIENGYEESFNRRFATIEDIKVSEILHSNVGKGEIKKVSIFDNIKSTNNSNKKYDFENVEEVNIETFMKDILPNCSSVEAFLKNSHENHLVTLTTSVNSNSKPIFKWSNNYSWTFNGNLAGKSQLAEMVELKGGRIDGVFRFTHSWNELEPNQSLMDLHVFMPKCQIPKQGAGGPHVEGRRVGWNRRNDVESGGVQDVDYTNPASKGYIPVENITFPTLSKMPDGVYTCMIHNWNFRKTGGKGRAEIAVEGQTFEYIYPKTTHQEWVTIAKVTLEKGKFTIEHVLQPVNSISKEIYGLETNNFHKVNLICLSPNHWDDNKVGNKHYFFMLENCKTQNSIRSFHNENLNDDLVAHRKVMEVLATTNTIEKGGEQLSGLGFNATVRDELILKLEGTFKRIIKIKF